MIDPTPEHRERALGALAKANEPLTARSLIARGSCWRAVMDMVRVGELRIVGSTACAKLLYAPADS